jgi:UDP-N-acetylmuramoyl-tripeptide--D-alanyl-D-alanine ligase
MSDTFRRILTFGNLVDWGKAQSGMSGSMRRRPAGDLWMDSRKIRSGDVFVALRGENDDGHRYVEQALKAGAGAAIVARSELSRFSGKLASKLIVADDPLKAVGRMARTYRARLNIPVIAVTGSNGKTTTRQFIAAVLGARFTVGETGGNWNNHIGVPLTILRLRGNEGIAVLELAANHNGEIAPLSRIASPDIAVITNIGYAHIGNFGSLTRTTDTKFEITAGMHGAGAFCLLNGDDSRLVSRARRDAIKAVFFGEASSSCVRPRDIAVSYAGETSFSLDGIRYTLPMAGRHYVMSALPAIFLGRWFGVPDTDIAGALRGLKPDAMRGLVAFKRGTGFIVDCYNANPSSMQSALTLLCDTVPAGRRAAIVGDMMELGRFAGPLHRQLGGRLGGARLRELIIVGSHAPLVAEAARAHGLKQSRIHCAADAAEALKIARTVLKPGDTVLLKASRAVKLESVFEGF